MFVPLTVLRIPALKLFGGHLILADPSLLKILAVAKSGVHKIAQTDIHTRLIGLGHRC